jgi:arsenate reductase
MITPLAREPLSLHAAGQTAALLKAFGPVSGADFNPAVSAPDWLLGRRARTGITAGDLGA